MTRTFLLSIVLVGLLGMVACTKSPSSSTADRIKKQKKRQKRNPGDCPRIDCSTADANNTFKL